MRVVVHHPAREEADGTQVAASKSAFRLGRITDHTDILTGATTPRDEVAAILLKQAQEEFPGQEVAIEHLHVAGRHPETGEVVAHEWKDHPPEQAVAVGEVHEQELAADQTQEAAS